MGLKTQPKFKPIKFRRERHAEIVELRDRLVKIRHNDDLSLPDVVSEAVKRFQDDLNSGKID